MPFHSHRVGVIVRHRFGARESRPHDGRGREFAHLHEKDSEHKRTGGTR